MCAGRNVAGQAVALSSGCAVAGSLKVCPSKIVLAPALCAHTYKRFTDSYVWTHPGFNVQNDWSNFALSSKGVGMLLVINIQLNIHGGHICFPFIILTC